MTPDNVPTLLEPWFALNDEESATTLEAELRREISAGHALARVGTALVDDTFAVGRRPCLTLRTFTDAD